MTDRQRAVLRLGAVLVVVAGIVAAVVPGLLGGSGDRVPLTAGEEVEVPDSGMLSPPHVTLFATEPVDVDELGCAVRQPSGEPSSADLFGPSVFDRQTISVDGVTLRPVLRVRAPSGATIRCAGERVAALEPLYLVRRSAELPVGWLRVTGIVAIVLGAVALMVLRASPARR